MSNLPSGEIFPVSPVLSSLLGSKVFLDTLPIGVYCCDAEGIIRYFNRRAAELWGHTLDVGDINRRFCGAHKLFLPDGSSLPHERTPMADLLKSGNAARDQQVVIERIDGSRITALVNIDPIFDNDQKLIGAVNCFQDISELARVKEELQRSKVELDDFFENGAICLHIVGDNGTILRANKAELELLGYSTSEYVGRSIRDFHADDHVIDDILVRLGRGEKLDKYPARLRAKDGSLRYVLITSNAQFRNGEFLHTRCFTVDVTGTKYAEDRAHESERLFRDVLEALPAAVYTTDCDGRITFYNRAAADLAGREIELGHDRWCVTLRLYRADGTPLPHDQCPMAMALKEQRPIRDVEAIAERPDGKLIRFIPYPTPLFDKHGRLSGAVNMMVDITERHEAEVESAYLASIVASSEDAIISKTLDGVVNSWNDGATHLLGYDASEMIGQPITHIIPPELHDEEKEILQRLRRGEHIQHFETMRVKKDGSRVDVSLSVSPVRSKAGQVIGVSSVARDISERKRADELQTLLISELNHRVKNTLATVQAIANQSVRHTGDPNTFAASFSGRIRALAQAHDLLTQNSWQGTDIHQLLRGQLLLGGSDDDRLLLCGPSMMLDAQLSLHLALIIHELGTNARKYGALSVPHGRLSVEWVVRTDTNRKLLLNWRESGGPTVHAPAKRGFGTTLIEKSLRTHGGEACISYGAEGVTCEITLSLPEFASSGERMSSHIAQKGPFLLPQSPPEALGINGRRILIVEDEPLIAMDMMNSLSDVGCLPVGPATSVKQAKELIETTEFEAALLDANLAGCSVDEVAAALTRRNIPFAFMTGYGREALPAAFRQARMINKPFSAEETVRLVAQLIQQSETAPSLVAKARKS